MIRFSHQQLVNIKAGARGSILQECPRSKYGRVIIITEGVDFEEFDEFRPEHKSRYRSCALTSASYHQEIVFQNASERTDIWYECIFEDVPKEENYKLQIILEDSSKPITVFEDVPFDEISNAWQGR